MMRHGALARFTRKALIILGMMVGATALGVALVFTLGPEALPAHAPVAPEALARLDLTPTVVPFMILSDLPTPTASPTRPPLPKATVLSPTPPPTFTPTATPTNAPTETLTPLPPPSETPTQRPPPTPIVPTLTPPPPREPTEVRFAAPTIVSPGNGERFGEEEQIVLVWQSVGTLPAGVYYAITLAYPHEGATWYDETPWIQETRWVMSEHRYLLDLADDGQFRWWVQVMRHTGVDAQGRPTGVPLSPGSEQRTLTWRRASGGGGGQPRPNTPEPPPP